MLRITACIGVVLWVLGRPASLPAQQQQHLRVGIASYSSEPSRPLKVQINPGTLEGTYWKAGAVLTGLPAAVGMFIMTEHRANVATRILGSAMIGAIAALPGALIGAQFRK
jgi:hypothetical protein